MTRLLLALNLTPTKLHDENLLHGAKLRKLITTIEDEMEDYNGNIPPIWSDYKKELEKIRSETFTTLRDKALTKLGMKISGIANEVNKTIANDQNLAQSGKIGKNQEDPTEVARKKLLRKIKDTIDVYDNQISKETDEINKMQFELSLMLIDLLKNKVIGETVLSKFTDHESALEDIKREGTKSFDSSFDPKNKPSDLKDEDLSKFATEFEKQLQELLDCHNKRKYSWRTTFDSEKLAIEGQITAIRDNKKEKNERLVARNLAELQLSRLSEKVRPLNIPLDMKETLAAKTVVKEFVADLDKLMGWVETEFKAPNLSKDITEIQKVLPTAVAKAKAPLMRLVDAIGQVESLLQGCNHAKEATLDSCGRQVRALAGLCITHCGSDQLISAWDTCPETVKKSTQTLKTSIETLEKQFNCIA